MPAVFHRFDARLFSRLALATVVSAVLLSLWEYGSLAFVRQALDLQFQRGPLYSAAYLVAYLASVSSLAVFVSLRSKVCSAIAVALLTALLSAHHAMLAILSEPLSVEHLRAASTAMHFAPMFLWSHWPSIFGTFVLSVGFIMSLSFAARRWLGPFGLRGFLLALLGASLACGIITRTRDVQSGFPSPFRTAYILLLSMLEDPLYAGERTAPPDEFVASNRPDAEIVMLIVDESISGSFLAINGYDRPTTPFLSSTAADYVNLGIAASSGNHSALSNTILLGLLKADQLPDTSQFALRGPSIFQYAQKAGFKTAFIDAQAVPNGFSNYMRPTDKSAIDFYHVVANDHPHVPLYQRDRKAIEKIREIVAAAPRTFFYVLKQGAHFHYERAYPPQEQVFRPVMKSTGSLGTSLTEEIHNSYANAVKWSVDGFLMELQAALPSGTSSVVYTADHGQSLEAGGQGVGTHGKVQSPPNSQAAVPMLVFGATAETRLRRAASDVHNRTSHFQIAPSLLIMMGYPEAEVIKRHGLPLWHTPTEQRLFISGDLFKRGRAFMNKFD